MMKPVNKEQLSMLCSYTGVYILFSTAGVYLYWGNLSVYTNSYFRDKLDSADSSIKTPWVTSFIGIGLAVSTTVSGCLAGHIGQRRAMILGCVLLDSGIFLTYFFIHQSVMAVNVCVGAVAGLGIGLIFGLGYVNIAHFQPKNLGLATAIVETGISGGAVVLSQLVTHYVNPNNLTPDLFDGREDYFTQESILDKVPSVYLVIGFFNCCCQVIGLCLLQAPKERGKHEQAIVVQKENCDCNHSSALTDNVNDMEKNELLNLKSPSANGISNGSQSKVKEETHTHTDTPAVPAPVENLSPKQVLKCRRFYVLWLSIGSCDYTYILLNNFYKSYGQTQISDDHFLANVSTILLLAAMLFRPVWGALLDKCGVKSTLIYISCAQCVVCALLYFTPMVSRWTYLVWITFYSSCTCGLYVMFPVSLIQLYGQAHFTENYGLVSTSVVLVGLTAPPIIRYVLGRFGWFYVFFSAACANALVICFCIIGLPGR